TKLSHEDISRFKGKIIARAGSGIDNIDWKAAIEYDKMVLTAPVSISYAVAELTILFILSLLRRYKTITSSAHPISGENLRGKTVGIIGRGHIGTLVESMLNSFGCNVFVFDPAYKKSTPLEEIYKNADILTYHVPFLPETKEMICMENIDKMAKRPYIINTSRPEIMKIEDVVDALEKGMIRGVAVDFYIPQLLNKDNVIMTPHIGASTFESQEGVAKEIAENIIQVVEGKFSPFARTWPSWYLPAVKLHIAENSAMPTISVPYGAYTLLVSIDILKQVISIVERNNDGTIYAGLEKLLPKSKPM
ncbi:MAG: NAD(P)-dependent oxidoreductase, partial [Candidatus Korarchaeota archaeon]